MLHALIEDPQAREILTRCRVDLAALKTDLEEVLDKAFTPVPGRKAVKPESTLGFDRVVERAVVHAASSSAQQVESGALLVFLLQEDESHAAYFLRKQGSIGSTLLRAISHGGAATPSSPRQGAGRRRRRASRDPLEAYATDLIAKAAKGGDRSADRPRSSSSSAWSRCSAGAARTTRCWSASRASARPRWPKAWRCAFTRATCPSR